MQPRLDIPEAGRRHNNMLLALILFAVALLFFTATLLTHL